MASVKRKVRKDSASLADFPTLDEVRWTFEHCPPELLSDSDDGPVLTAVRLLPRRDGNQLWELELKFYSSEFRCSSYSMGRSFRGYLSCHMSRDFVAYRIRLGKEILWFDCPKLALAAFLHVENVPYQDVPVFSLESPTTTCSGNKDSSSSSLPPIVAGRVEEDGCV